MNDSRLVAWLRTVCPVEAAVVRTPGDPVSVRVQFGDGATLAQQKACIDALAAYDWSPATQATWDVGRASLAAISLVAVSTDPIFTADRIILRFLCTALNDVREHAGMTRLLEPAIVAGLIAAAQGGAGAPATVPAGP